MSGETKGSVRIILRLEGLLVVFASLVAYSKLGFAWSTFAIYFLVPDLSLLGYLVGTKVGAVTYNTAHSYIGAISCILIGFLFPSTLFLCAGVIWCAHVGFDRALGYGLKYSEGFGFTHLGLIGRFAKNKT